MRLEAGAVRELHWRKEGEWAYMLKGGARVTSVDQDLRTYQDDIGEGEGWWLCHVRGFYLSIARGALSPHVYISMP